MPNVSPKVLFWISFIVTVGEAITNGTVHLAHIIPTAYQEAVDSWIALAVFLCSTFVTMAAGAGMTKQSVIASAAAVPEVQKIVTTPDLADAAPSDKVVGPK